MWLYFAATSAPSLVVPVFVNLQAAAAASLDQKDWTALDKKEEIRGTSLPRAIQVLRSVGKPLNKKVRLLGLAAKLKISPFFRR